MMNALFQCSTIVCRQDAWQEGSVGANVGFKMTVQSLMLQVSPGLWQARRGQHNADIHAAAAILLIVNSALSLTNSCF